ncbi:MAG: ATP-dependent zinc protease [Gammaproteobacteria bacterium]
MQMNADIRWPVAVLTILSLLMCSAVRASAEPPGNKIVFGWIEQVRVSAAGLVLEAKLDTGADTSSLHARNIHGFKRQGVRMVRFEIENPETGELVQLERKRMRGVRIREHNGGYQRRPVVEMWVCLGQLKKRIEVNLVDRSQFNYPFLIGRSAMHGEIIVDPDRSFTTSPECVSLPE